MMYYRTITLDLFTYLLFKFTSMWSIHVSCCRRDIRAEIKCLTVNKDRNFCLLRSYQIRNVLYLPYSIPAPNLNFLINILPMG